LRLKQPLLAADGDRIVLRRISPPDTLVARSSAWRRQVPDGVRRPRRPTTHQPRLRRRRR
jgi:hypothetical protein